MKEFKTDWEQKLEKDGFYKIHKRVWIKESSKGKYKVVFECASCNLPSSEITRTLQANRTAVNKCEHCDTTQEYSIKGRDVIIKQTLEKPIARMGVY